jgi:hypothetical protein
MSEYDKMKAHKEEILSRELQVICSSCGGTCIYKRENNRVVFTHCCTPPQVRERIRKLRKLAWPWIPARQGQITFDEWSELVRWVTDSEMVISEAKP